MISRSFFSKKNANYADIYIKSTYSDGLADPRKRTVFSQITNGNPYKLELQYQKERVNRARILSPPKIFLILSTL